jgi:hypothetical protein
VKAARRDEVRRHSRGRRRRQQVGEPRGSGRHERRAHLDAEHRRQLSRGDPDVVEGALLPRACGRQHDRRFAGVPGFAEPVGHRNRQPFVRSDGPRHGRVRRLPGKVDEHVMATRQQQRHQHTVGRDVGDRWSAVLEITDPHLDVRPQLTHPRRDCLDDVGETTIGAAVRDQDQWGTGHA